MRKYKIEITETKELTLLEILNLKEDDWRNILKIELNIMVLEIEFLNDGKEISIKDKKGKYVLDISTNSLLSNEKIVEIIESVIDENE